MTKLWHGLQRLFHRLQRIVRSPFFWIAIHAVLLLPVFISLAWLYYTSPSPGAAEYKIAMEILGGQIPYHDFAFEYPPLALLILVIPGLFFRSLSSYFIAFAVEIFLFDVIAIALIVYISRRLNMSTVRSLVFYTLFMAVVAGPIVIQRYDLVPAVLVLVALVALIKERNNWAWAMLALGVVAKLFPLVVAPLFFIWHIAKRQYGQLIKGVAVFSAVILATVIPWVVIDAQGFWHSISYHLERGLHAESSYGSFILLGQLLGFTHVQGGFSPYNSYDLTSPLADSLAAASFYIMAALLLALYLLFAFQLKKRQNKITSLGMPAAEAESLLLRYSALVIIAFLASSKVFSIQYLIWLCPLLPLLDIRRSSLIFILFLIAGAFTLYIYPFNYTPFARFENLPVLIMARRNLLIIVIGFLILFSGRARVAEKSYP